MSTVTDCLATEPAASFTYGGRVYRVAYLKQKKKAEFEQWVRARALALLPGLRDVLSPDEYGSARGSLFADLAGGRYGFHGIVCQSAFQTPDGVIALASILAGITEDEAAELMVDCKQPFLDAISLALQCSRPTPKDAPEGNDPTPAERKARRRKKKSGAGA